MGSPDQLAKRVFSEEIPTLFGSAVEFHAGLDLGFSELRLDGLLRLTQPLDLSAMPAPWSQLRPGGVVIETKMPGDHTDRLAFSKAMVRRQVLEATRLGSKPPETGPVALWMVAPHAPEWLWEEHQPKWIDVGCYRLPHGPIEVLWVVANDLPLRESLLPFLVARSGKKLAELVRWALERRPAAWVTRVLTWSNMSPEMVRELEAEMKAYGLERGETEEERARQKQAAKLMLLMVPEVSEELRAAGLREGHDAGLREGREALERVEREGREALERAEREGREAQEREARQAVADLCEVLGVELTAARQADLSGCDQAGLAALRAHLKAHRAWP